MRSELDRTTLEVNPHLLCIDNDVSRSRRIRQTGGSSDKCPHSRDQLLHMKGLRHIVIRASLDTMHPLEPTAPRSQDEHGRTYPFIAPDFQDHESIELWQPEV